MLHSESKGIFVEDVHPSLLMTHQDNLEPLFPVKHIDVSRRGIHMFGSVSLKELLT